MPMMEMEGEGGDSSGGIEGEEKVVKGPRVDCLSSSSSVFHPGTLPSILFSHVHC